MALSKPVVPEVDTVNNFKETLDKNEILNYTTCSIKESLSIDVIYGYLGGIDTTYYCYKEDQSCECYHVCKRDLLETLNGTNLPMVFFEELQTCLMNCMVAVIHQKKKGQREHLTLHCLVQMTLTTTLKVRFARNHTFTGKGSISIALFLVLTAA